MGGPDEFTRVREEEENSKLVYRTTKATELLEVNILWEVFLDGSEEELNEEELDEMVLGHLNSEGSYQIAHYLKSTDHPPLTGLLIEGAGYEFVESSGEDGGGQETTDDNPD
jgi:hypothetical protein